MKLKTLAAAALALFMMSGPAVAQNYFSPGHEKKEVQPAPPSDLMPWFRKSVEDSPDVTRPSNTLVTVCTDMTLTTTVTESLFGVHSVLFIVNSWSPQERLTGVEGPAGTWTVDWVMPCDTKPDHNYKVLIELVDTRGEYTVAVQWIFLRQ
jgi:hypothetical protein